MSREILFQIALTRVPMIGPVHSKILIEQFGSAQDIFAAKPRDLERLEGIGSVRAKSIRTFRNFTPIEQEIIFLKKYGITPLFYTDNSYPRRLKNCYDPPALLYFKGNADLNSQKTIGIVGTRNNSEYGRIITEKLLKDLEAQENILIISGLANGIDALAHIAALQNNLPTIGVLAHGLDTIYPENHTSLAKQMLSNGGLLTEFTSKTKPDRHNFPSRNRIVAGICDAVVVVETSMKGGSMITADLANGYNRDVFAFPGKITDTRSSGCNYLIRQNKAVLLTDAGQLLETMGWEKTSVKIKPIQRSFFHDLSPQENIIVNLLNEKGQQSIDELKMKTGLNPSALAGSILELELKSIIESLPGKLFRLQ